MNVFRRPSGSTLKLLTLSWRKPLTAAVSPSGDMTKMTGCRINLCHYSSSAIEPKSDPDQSADRKQEDNVDPFGIGEVVNSNDKILVQGFYGRPDGPAASSPPPPAVASVSTPAPKPTPPKVPQPEDDDPDKRSRLSLYNTWIKQRVNLEASQNSETGETESYREAHFGQVRIDSDNPVRTHGRHHEGRIELTPEKPLRSRRTRLAKKPDPADNEPITETIEADHSVRMRASDFLEQIRAKEQGKKAESESERGEEVHPRENIVIERIIRPRNPPPLDASDPKNYISTIEQALTMDSNEVPKSYLLPDYNAITELDMWNVLRKSVVFQNDFILAINKPSGIPVHSKGRDCRHTVIQFLKKFADFAKCEEVFPLHRIDKDTTGVLLFAKDKKVAAVLKEKFASRQIHKVYLGVTKLSPGIREGTIKIPIGEGLIPGTKKYRRVLRPDLREYGIQPTTKTCVEAITNYKVLHSIKEAAFVEIEPVTGYKHQIRVHFGMGLGCPIFGDHKYSHRDRLAPQRLHPHVLHKIKLKQTKVREMPLHLHCNKISFTLPKEFTESQEPVYIHANIPYFMKYTLKRLGLIR